ncbi:MAG: PaaI family thioesterase [Casimicrobiaceae bacterium]
MALRPGFTLETMRNRGVGRLPGLLGIELTHVGERRMEARLAIRPELLAPNGFLHAATVVALADTMCGYGTIAHLPEGAENFTTVELKSNHLATAREGTITVIATPAHLGRSTQVWDAVVTHLETGRTIALFRCTQLILWPKTEARA